MCVPAAGLALSLLSGVASYAQASAETKAYNAAAKQNTINAISAANKSYEQSATKITQEREAAIQKKTEQQVENMKASSTAQVSAGEGGAAGNTVFAVLGDYYAKSGRFNDAVDNNFQMAREFVIGERDAQYAQTQNQINSMPPKAKPSPLMIFSNLSL